MKNTAIGAGTSTYYREHSSLSVASVKPRRASALVLIMGNNSSTNSVGFMSVANRARLKPFLAIAVAWNTAI